MFKNSDCQSPFTRYLPGGGFVMIEVRPVRSIWRTRGFRGRIVVERRSTSRGEGHKLPMIAKAGGPSIESVVQKLLPTAQCNAAIAAALLRLEPKTPRRAAHSLSNWSGQPRAMDRP
jgi:hypothetical protein